MPSFRQSHLAAIFTLITYLANNPTFEKRYQKDKYFTPILETLQHSDNANKKEKV